MQCGEWLTVRDCKRVLVVIHTITYAKRLRDVLSLLESDLRVQAVFTVAPHAFGDGVLEYLRRMGISTIPWQQAVNAEFDLALAAGSRGIDQIRAPLIRIAHGVGHIKLLRASEQGSADTGQRVAAMLSRAYLMRDGRVVPAAIALPHARDRETLAWSCPEALPAATVVGDPSHDRILASLAHRGAYRAALGMVDGQELVVVSSTWGTSASFQRLDALLPRLLGELPGDRYRTVVLVHPNVAAGHGDWQVRSWLADFRRRGVAVAAPETDWHAVLVAADWFIGDHGSLSSYAALTGVPILLACHPVAEVAAHSPAAELARSVPALSASRPLAEQFRYAAERCSPERYRGVAELVTSEPGRFNRRMRALIYRLLALGEPAFDPVMEPAAPPPPLARWTTGESAA